jgi:hypothetical protein
MPGNRIALLSGDHHPIKHQLGEKAMSKKENKNALKHGVFANAVILPGEDPEEFEELYNSVKREWDPDGPTEDDCVFSLTNYLWRKRRIARYYKRKIASAVKADKQILHQEIKILVMLERFRDFIVSDDRGPITEQDVTAKLGKSWAEYFHTYVPREKYQNDNDWLTAFVRIINRYIEMVVEDEFDYPKTQDILSEETFMERELAIEERLDAMIDKTLKRLAQTKALKTMGIGNRRAWVTNESSTSKALTKVEAPAIKAVESEEDNPES